MSTESDRRWLAILKDLSFVDVIKVTSEASQKVFKKSHDAYYNKTFNHIFIDNIDSLQFLYTTRIICYLILNSYSALNCLL